MRSLPGFQPLGPSHSKKSRTIDQSIHRWPQNRCWHLRLIYSPDRSNRESSSVPISRLRALFFAATRKTTFSSVDHLQSTAWNGLWDCETWGQAHRNDGLVRMERPCDWVYRFVFTMSLGPEVSDEDFTTKWESWGLSERLQSSSFRVDSSCLFHYLLVFDYRLSLLPSQELQREDRRSQGTIAAI